MFKKAHPHLLLISLLATILIMVLGLPRSKVNSRDFSKSFPEMPEAVEKINSISTQGKDSLTIPVPATYKDYQIFVGKKLENLDLKVEVAKEFEKFAGPLLKDSSTEETKIFADKLSKKNKDPARFILKKSGELFYQKNKKSKAVLLAAYDNRYFEDITLFKSLVKNYKKITEMSDKQDNLTFNLAEFDKLAFTSKTLTFVFYRKTKEKKQKRFHKPYSTATEIVISEKSQEKGVENPTFVSDGEKSISSASASSRANTDRIERQFPSDTSNSSNSSESNSSSAGCEAYGSGSGNEGEPAFVAIYGDGTAEIESVSISNEEPKPGDWKNADSHLGQFDWKYKISADGQSAEATGTGYKWFGYGNGDNSCTEVYAPASDAGVYTADLEISYANGCIAEKQIEINTNYTGTKGATSVDLAISGFSKERLPGYPNRAADFLPWKCCFKAACTGSNCIKINASISEEHEEGLQYYTLAHKEEAYHVRQSLSQVDWSNGGLSLNGVKLTDTSEFISKYELGSVCANSYNQVSACQKAETKVTEKAIKAMKGFRISTIKWQTKTRCHVEKTAKEAIGLTADRAGFHYACTYMKTHDCPADGGFKKYFWEFLGK